MMIAKVKQAASELDKLKEQMNDTEVGADRN